MDSRLRLLIGAVLLAAACSAKTPAVIDTNKPDTLGTLQLFSYGSIGQGCPVSDRAILTARHVATQARPIGPPDPLFVVWADGLGHTGSAWVVDWDLRRDLALMRTDKPLARWYQLAQSRPDDGVEVTIVGYDYGNELRADVVKVKVLNMAGAHLVLSRGGQPGFSGSCVLDAQGHVVGVFVWAITSGTSQYGIAVPVWGEWSAVDWVPPDAR